MEESTRVDTEMNEIYDTLAPTLTFSRNSPARIDDNPHGTDIFSTTQETLDNVRRLNNKKSYGHDGLSNYFIKKLPFEFFVYLTIIFNHCANLTYFPDFWKLGTGSPILKHGKSPEAIASYRPVMLLSNLAKLLERHLHKQMEKFCEDNNVIPHHQFGFRPGLSTAHALHTATSVIANALNKRNPVLALSIDTEKAFDAVWHGGLILRMHQYGFPFHLTRMIHNYLKDRYLSVMIDGAQSSWKKIRAGVPQGAILSPILYVIFTALMPVSGDRDTHSIMYADDQLLLATGENPKETIENMNELADEIFEFCYRWKIRINES